MYVIRVPADRRRGLIEHLRAHGVHADLRYAPCHHQPLFAQQDASLPVTDGVAQELLRLPLFVGMTPEDVRMVARFVTGHFRA